MDSLIAFLLRGQFPDPLKLLIIVAGFRFSSHAVLNTLEKAILNTLEKVYLSMVSMVEHMCSPTASFQLVFLGLKNPASHGWST